MIDEGTVNRVADTSGPAIRQPTSAQVLGGSPYDSIMDEDFSDPPAEVDLPVKSIPHAAPPPVDLPGKSIPPASVEELLDAPESPEEPEKPWDSDDGAFFARIGFSEYGRYRGTKYPAAWELNDETAKGVGERLSVVMNKHGLNSRFRDEIKLGVAVYVAYTLCRDAERNAPRPAEQPQIPAKPAVDLPVKSAPLDLAHANGNGKVVTNDELQKFAELLRKSL